MIEKEKVFGKETIEKPSIDNDMIPIELEVDDRDVSIQEIIDALEANITKLETCTNEEKIKWLSKTVVLICKILSVELNKTISEDLGNTYIT